MSDIDDDDPVEVIGFVNVTRADGEFLGRFQLEKSDFQSPYHIGNMVIEQFPIKETR